MKSVRRYTKIQYKISHDSKILFIGANPSPGTYHRGIPFSNNKSFWYLLHEAGLVDEDRTELQDDRMLKQIYEKKLMKVYHLGILNLVDRPTKTFAEIKPPEAVPGVPYD